MDTLMKSYEKKISIISIYYNKIVISHLIKSLQKL